MPPRNFSQPLSAALNGVEKTKSLDKVDRPLKKKSTLADGVETETKDLDKLKKKSSTRERVASPPPAKSQNTDVNSDVNSDDPPTNNSDELLNNYANKMPNVSANNPQNINSNLETIESNSSHLTQNSTNEDLTQSTEPSNQEAGPTDKIPTLPRVPMLSQIPTLSQMPISTGLPTMNWTNGKVNTTSYKTVVGASSVQRSEMQYRSSGLHQNESRQGSVPGQLLHQQHRSVIVKPAPYQIPVSYSTMSHGTQLPNNLRYGTTLQQHHGVSSTASLSQYGQNGSAPPTMTTGAYLSDPNNIRQSSRPPPSQSSIRLPGMQGISIEQQMIYELIPNPNNQPTTTTQQQPYTTTTTSTTTGPRMHYPEAAALRSNCRSNIQSYYRYHNNNLSTGNLSSHQVSSTCGTRQFDTDVIYPPIEVIDDGIRENVRRAPRKVPHRIISLDNVDEYDLRLAEYNSTLLYLNPKIKGNQAFKRLPFLISVCGSIPFLPKGTSLPNIFRNPGDNEGLTPRQSRGTRCCLGSKGFCCTPRTRQARGGFSSCCNVAKVELETQTEAEDEDGDQQQQDQRYYGTEGTSHRSRSSRFTSEISGQTRD